MSLINAQQLQNLRDLAAGDDQFLKNVFGAFLPQLELTPRALRQALEAGFYEKAADLAHSLKGSASNVGAAEVARISQEIERLTRKSTGDTVRPLLDELDTVALATRDILQREIDD